MTTSVLLGVSNVYKELCTMRIYWVS